MEFTWRSTWRYVAGLALIGVLLWYPFVQGQRVPLLWAADLGFHELGHLLMIGFGETAHFVAGSVTQVLVPLGLAAYFWVRQRELLATGLMLAWAASAAQDASVYIADAPYQDLPLIGGHHDWNFLLSRWELLDSSAGIARGVWAAGLVLGVVGAVVCAAPLAENSVRVRRKAPAASPGGPRPVREARFRRPPAG